MFIVYNAKIFYFSVCVFAHIGHPHWQLPHALLLSPCLHHTIMPLLAPSAHRSPEHVNTLNTVWSIIDECVGIQRQSSAVLFTRCSCFEKTHRADLFILHLSVGSRGSSDHTDLETDDVVDMYNMRIQIKDGSEVFVSSIKMNETSTEIVMGKQEPRYYV